MPTNTLMSWSERKAGLAVPLLNRMIKAKLGHGGIAKMEKSLEKPERWWQGQKKKKSISLSDLLAVLAAIGVSLGEFEAALNDEIGEEEPDEDLPARPDEVGPGEPMICVLAHQAIKALPREKQNSALQLLEKIDEDRYDDPVLALESLVSFIPGASSRHEVSMALEIAGGCYRLLYRPQRALSCLDLALKSTEDVFRRSCILLRMASSYNMIEPTRSLPLIVDAREISCSHRDLHGVGRSYISEALSFAAMYKHDQARAAYSSSLLYSEQISIKDLAGAHQGMATSCHRLGMRSEALLHAEKARGLANHLGNLNLEAHTEWVLGLISSDAAVLTSAIELFGTRFYFDAVICSLDLLELLQERSQRDLMDALLIQVEWAHRNKLLFPAKIYENLVAQFRMGKKLDIMRARKQIRGWRASSISNRLARRKKL